MRAGRGIPSRAGTAVAGVAALIACLATVAGCGSTTFTAEELVAELNAHGAEVALGEPLAAEGAVEIHSLELGDPAEDGDDHAHAGGGSLMIAEDDESALAEYQRCESAASLLCFRAANAVLLLEDSVQRDDLARLESAVRSLASD